MSATASPRSSPQAEAEPGPDALAEAWNDAVRDPAALAASRKAFIKKELAAVADAVPADELVSCFKTLIQIRIHVTPYREVTMNLQFPEEYPHQRLVIELKSHTFPHSLLDKLTEMCARAADKQLAQGKPQTLAVYSLLSTFVKENILLSCWSEIQDVRDAIAAMAERQHTATTTTTTDAATTDADAPDTADADAETTSLPQTTVKLKERDGTIKLDLRGGLYRLCVRLRVSPEYPDVKTEIEVVRSNFTEVYERMFVLNAREIVRVAVDGPLHQRVAGKGKKGKPAKAREPWQPQRHLADAAMFLVDRVLAYPTEVCQLCEGRLFPEDPREHAATKPSKDKMIERVYCGHFFHYGCLNTYMHTPPFPEDGKKCPGCRKRIFHKKWSSDMKALESTWAHKEARRREIGEVVEFMGVNEFDATTDADKGPAWLQRANAVTGANATADAAKGKASRRKKKTKGQVKLKKKGKGKGKGKEKDGDAGAGRGRDMDDFAAFL